MSIHIINNSQLQYIIYVIHTNDNLMGGTIINQVPAEFSSGTSSSNDDISRTQVLNPNDNAYLPYLWGSQYYLMHRNDMNTTTGKNLPEIRFRSNCFMCGNRSIQYTINNNPNNTNFHLLQNGKTLVMENVNSAPLPAAVTAVKL
jgi:hypothetical protein